MQLILLERVEKLGRMGDIVNVKPGYARNFLLPNKKAMRANKDNIAAFEAKKLDLEAHNLSMKQDADAICQKMDKQSVIIVRQSSDKGHLYGSVNTRDIAEALHNVGFIVKRSQIILDRPIKSLGSFEVRIVLHPEVSAFIKVDVANSALNQIEHVQD